MNISHKNKEDIKFALIGSLIGFCILVIPILKGFGGLIIYMEKENKFYTQYKEMLLENMELKNTLLKINLDSADSKKNFLDSSDSEKKN